MTPLERVNDIAHKSFFSAGKLGDIRVCEYMAKRLASLARNMLLNGDIYFDFGESVTVDFKDGSTGLKYSFDIHVPGVGDITWPEPRTLDVMEESLDTNRTRHR